MTIVHGQIESLTRIKETLRDKGIDRFNSLGDIKKFKSQYELEQQNVTHQVEQEVAIEIENLKAELAKFQTYFDNLKDEETKLLTAKIAKLKIKHDFFYSTNTTNLYTEILYWFRYKIFKLQLTILETYFEAIITLKTFGAKNKLKKASKTIDKNQLNKEKIVAERSAIKLKELNYTKKVIDSLDNLIAGADGEHLVEKELQKLTGKNILFNDFSMQFKPPIYNKKENDRIYSIQIDHLLVTNAGIFIIETKNWSKISLESPDLRSPVEQIRRTNYALFVIINSDSKRRSIGFNRHHWGSKQLPIRNVVAMIRAKPKEQFQHVRVKTLKELNNYISYFDPIFNDSEVENISEYLKQIKN